MKTIGISFLLGTALLAFAQKRDPATTLFDIGVQDEQSGRLDRAKLTLLTLASTYYESPLAGRAKVEIGAIYIFGEAQAQMRSGQLHDAYNKLNTVTRVYPESALAKLASAEMRNLDPEGKWKR
jgi:outer membrane protein assembly factor BamD (BamD/ComL family)